MMSEENKVLILYTHPNVGKKVITGPATMHRYGYYGGGMVFEVFKDDARMRPDYFGTCGNCRQQLTITPQDVFCPRCSQIGSATINRPEPEQVVQAVQKVIPEPEPVQDPVLVSPQIEEEQLQKMLEVTTEYPVTPLEDVDFGRGVNKHHLSLLKAEGITTLEGAKEAGPEKLVSIKGIGQKVVDNIMSKA
jgi:hypothetical protein